MTDNDASGAPRPRRRNVLRAAGVTVLGAGAVTGAGAGVMRALNDDDGSSGGRLLLQADAASGVGMIERPVRDLGLKASGNGSWQTPVLDTSLVSMVGFTWRDGVPQPRILVRFRTGAKWSLWLPAPLLHDLPDPKTGEGMGKAGTSLVLTPSLAKPADALQIQVNDHLPPELAVTLIHAARLTGDARIAATAARTGSAFAQPSARTAAVGAKATTAVAAPAIYSRADWGANESWRSGAPRYNDTILQAHVHHSASGNSYTQADVPGLIRSFYKYHTKSLGWSDIAYNFLIDAYGTIWEGRAGGVDQAVRGAHTLGFNNASTGFCVIGNYDSAVPTAAVMTSLSRLAGWKLAMYGRDPAGWTEVTSEGSDKFPNGRVVTLPVIDGHRDTNDTACPGGNLFAQLANLRAATAGVITAATLKLKTPYGVKGKTILGHTLTVGDGKFKPTEAAVGYQWLRNGAAITGAVASTYVLTPEDVGQAIGVIVTGTIAGAAPVQQGVVVDRPVRSIPVCTVRTQRKPKGKVIVHVDVTAPGILVPDGQVVVILGKRTRTVQVKKGKAIARFVGVEPGRWKVRCKYSGGTNIRPGKASDWVRVPGKGPNARLEG